MDDDYSYSRQPAFRVKNNRSCSATTCGVLQIFVNIFLMALTIFYLAYFAYTNDKLKKNLNSNGSHNCLLFAKSDNLGSAGTCSFFIAGSGVSIGLLFILTVLGVFSSLCGKWSVCLKCFEIFILSLAIIINFSTCIVMSIGYHMSCSKLGKSNSDVFRSEKVYQKMSTIEPIAWITTVAMILFCMVQLFFCLCICYSRIQSKNSSSSHMFDEKALLNSKSASQIYT